MTVPFKRLARTRKSPPVCKKGIRNPFPPWDPGLCPVLPNVSLHYAIRTHFDFGGAGHCADLIGIVSPDAFGTYDILAIVSVTFLGVPFLFNVHANLSWVDPPCQSHFFWNMELTGLPIQTLNDFRPWASPGVLYFKPGLLQADNGNGTITADFVM